MAEVIKPWQTLPDEEMAWSTALVSGAQNLPMSTVKAGGEIVDAVIHPIETGHTILKLMQGSFHLLIPDDIQKRFDPEGKTEESQQMALQVGQYFQEKYGGEENIKHVIATDPASVLMDIATIMTGGAALVSKVGKLSKVAAIESAGSKTMSAAQWVDPITASLKGTGKAITGAGILSRELTGATSGVSGNTVGAVYDTSRESSKDGSFFSRGDSGNKLITAMRDPNFDLQSVVDIVMRDLELMKKQRGETYRSNKELWGKDQTILDFKDIDKAMERAESIVMYKGSVKNPVGLEALRDLGKVIDEWKSKDPRTHHTPEGMDALKQKIWSVVEGVDATNATAKGVAQNIYGALKDTISKQSPAYANAMKEYSDATEMVTQIQKTLSLGQGKKVNVDAAIRKLTSLMRNNVNTNYSQRVKLAKELEGLKGAEEFMPQLAGSQMNSLMPRNIQGAILPTLATSAVYSGGGSIPAAASMMATGSPRVIGEAAHMGGYFMGKLDKLPMPSYQGIEGMLEILYQTQAQMENKQNQ
tara:strand:+ start:602 stop:2191 length:1590 start_codon:yes stop_codon:yes gene_type:complete